MKLRTAVHRRFHDDDGKDYVFVQPSAALFGLDHLADELLTAFDGDGRDAADFLTAHRDGAVASAALQDLVQMGAIRPVDDVAPPAAELPPMPYPLATLVLNVTNKCNLSCTYCYEYGADKLPGQGGDQAPGRKRAPMMDAATACDSVDFLLKNAADRPQVSITFFGGETLLNFATIRAAVEYAALRGAELKKRVHFSLTTNATLLDDDVIAFLTAHRFGITISIDGDKQEQDRHRRYRSGKGSFDDVLPKIRRLLAANVQQRGRPVGARVTLTRGAASVRDTYDYLHGELGFDEVGFAPVTSGQLRAWALDAAAYDAMLVDFAALADDFVEAAVRNEPHGFANLNDLLRELHTGVNKAHPCGAGLGLLGVSTEGELGLCHRFVESDSHSMGSLRDGIDQQKRSDFLRAAHVDKKTDCKTCFARPVCAGGCYHEANVRYGKATVANLHYCDWIRGWTDIGLRAYARISNRNPSWFARHESS